MATRDDVNVPVIAAVGILAVSLLVAIILLLEVVFYHVQSGLAYEKDISQPYAEVANLMAEQQAKLAEYRWVDKDKRVVAIPIARAMSLVVSEEVRRGKPAEAERREKGGQDEGID
jgi:hypothetical protein